MATFTIPEREVQHSQAPSYFDTKNWHSYWGATIRGDYGSNPYSLIISKINVTAKWKHDVNGGLGKVTTGYGSGTLTIYSYGPSGSLYSSKSISITLSGDTSTYLTKGTYCILKGSRSGSFQLKLHPDGGRLRGYLKCGGVDYGMIYASSYYPSDYVPVNPDISINVNSNNINNMTVSLNSSLLTDLSSYSYTFNVFTDASRTQLAWTKTGTSINDFPFAWNSAVPGTTYYWSLDVSGTNSRTGGTVYMPTKTGSISTQTPWINTETFNYTASPLFNGHWTPRTQINYQISESTPGDYIEGLTFVAYEIQTAINGLNSNTKSHRVTSTTGTISLTDTSKLVRAVKPRDLLYVKVRVVCKDPYGREYYSNWFGITTAQYIYNKFHVYISNPSINNQLRINSRLMFSNKQSENYWNIGEVK